MKKRYTWLYNFIQPDKKVIKSKINKEYALDLKVK